MKKAEERVVEAETKFDDENPYFNKNSWFVYLVVFGSIFAIFADKIF